MTGSGEDGLLASGRDADDGSAGSLKISAVVEIGNQNRASRGGSSGCESSGNGGHAVRIQVSVWGDSRGRKALQRIQNRVPLSKSRALQRNEDHGNSEEPYVFHSVIEALCRTNQM